MSQTEKPKVVGVSKVLCNGVQRLNPISQEREAIVTTFSDGLQLVSCDALRHQRLCHSANRGTESCVHFRYRREVS